MAIVPNQRTCHFNTFNLTKLNTLLFGTKAQSERI